MERKCQRKRTPEPPSITTTLQRHIVRRRSITAKANTIRATRSRPRLTNIRPKLIVTQPTPTARAGKPERRNSVFWPGQKCPGLWADNDLFVVRMEAPELYSAPPPISELLADNEVALIVVPVST